MENNEIDLFEIIVRLWRKRKVISCFIIVFLIAGLVLAFLLPRKYTADCTLGLAMEDRITRISVEGMSTFQTMNVADIRDAQNIPPAMYPDILFSVPFQKELIYTPLYVNENGDSVTVYTYLTSKPIPHKIWSEGGVERLTPEEAECISYLKKAITPTVNSKEGNLKISVDMPEARMAAQIAEQIQLMLQRHITGFRIAKAQAALDFVEERYEEVKAELEKRQKALVEFHEERKGPSSIRQATEEKILTNDYELFFALYFDIVKQREKARIQVKENMPVLTVIEPVVEPSAPSKPQCTLIMLAALFLGLFTGCGWVLLSPLFHHSCEGKAVTSATNLK